MILYIILLLIIAPTNSQVAQTTIITSGTKTERDYQT